jgi:hypothetical protein
MRGEPRRCRGLRCVHLLGCTFFMVVATCAVAEPVKTAPLPYVASSSATTRIMPSTTQGVQGHASMPQLPFSPRQCRSGDRKYVFWAARRQVFRFPFDERQPIFPRTGADSALVGRVPGLEEISAAPAPTEPEGCYGNPLRGGDVPYMPQFAAQLFAQVMGRPMGINPGGRAWTRRQYAMDNLIEARANATSAARERAFRTGRDCWTRSPGIHECLGAAAVSRADYRSGHVLKIDQHLLVSAGALAGPVYVYLLPTFRPGEMTSAMSTIVVFGSVQLDDDFELFPHEINALPRYYAGLIQYLAGARVPGYQWNPVRK